MKIVADLEAAIALMVKASSDQTAATKRMADAYQRLVLTGRRVELSGSGVAVQGQNLLIDLGAPPSGMLWELKQLIVGPPDFSVAAVVGGVTTYAFGGTKGDFSPNASLGYTNQWPAQSFFGTHETYIAGMQRLSVLVQGLATGSQVFAAALVLQSPLDTTERVDL